jgi:hypothetical protein
MQRRTVGFLAGEEDAKSSGVCSNLLQKRVGWWRAPIRISHVGAAGGVEDCCAISHRTGDGMFGNKTTENVAEVRAEGVAGSGGLQPEDTTAGSGNPE